MPINEIESCQLSSIGTTLAIVGTYGETVSSTERKTPVLITLKTEDGSVDSMTTFNYGGESTPSTSYTLDAIFLDDKDNLISTDSYFYIGMTW